MSRHHSDVTCLNHLATILIDARKLYAHAARIADDPQVIDRIEQTMAERERLLVEIHALVTSFRGVPVTEGSLLGAAHKAFLNVRAIFDRDEKASLAEVQRGERYLNEEIRKAMRNDDLSAETRAFLGLALDRIVTGEMRIEGKLEEIKHMAPPKSESFRPIPPHG